MLDKEHTQKKKLFIKKHRRYWKKIEILFDIYKYNSKIILASVDILYVCIS